MYILGKHITLETDHKPLIPLFSTKHLDDIPIRIQRFRIRLMRYDYNIVHVPGKELIIADALSRAPRVSTDGGDLEQEVDAYVNLILETLPATERRLQEIKTQLETDPILQQVTSYCRDGWPDYISLDRWISTTLLELQSGIDSTRWLTAEKFQNRDSILHAPRNT